MRKFEFIVPLEMDNKTAKIFLKNYLGLSTAAIRKIKWGDSNFLCNNNSIRIIDILHKDDVINFTLDEPSEILPFFADDVEFVFFDEDVMVANKPCGMVTHRAKSHQELTLENAYAGFLSSNCISITGFKPVYRLDKDTSGLIVIARHSIAADFLSKTVDKEYYAICSGLFDQKIGMINAPIGRESPLSHKRAVVENGQNAITRYDVLDERSMPDGTIYSLVHFKLITGRTHQIRVHMDFINHPLAGDNFYGGNCSLIQRQALHCGKVSFCHPITKETIVITAQLPKDMSAFGFDYIIN